MGDELWIGYASQAFDTFGPQGISRFNERTGALSRFEPAQIGTASPVRSMALMPNGDVWALFSTKPEMPMDIEFSPPYVEDKRDAQAGLGRFSGGKWQFPVKLEGVPETREVESPTREGMRKVTIPLQIMHMACVGGRLFVIVATSEDPGEAVYVGPGKWQPIYKGPVFRLPPAEDGKSLIIWIRGRNPAEKGPV